MVRMAMEAKSDDPPLCHAHNYIIILHEFIL